MVSDDGELVQPGDDTIGMLGVGGAIPLGYYKDPEKTATTFRTVHGRRYSVPGDYASVDDDGTIRLLGRGSACINTGGEKVYPEEVEPRSAPTPTCSTASSWASPTPAGAKWSSRSCTRAMGTTSTPTRSARIAALRSRPTRSRSR